jgi:hypothetical protein
MAATKFCLSPGRGGGVSLEPQPFPQFHPSAPKTQWVMVAALWYRPSDSLEPLRLLWGRFEGKGAVGRRSPFPVADSPETTPPCPRLKTSTHHAKKFQSKTLRSRSCLHKASFAPSALRGCHRHRAEVSCSIKSSSPAGRLSCPQSRRPLVGISPPSISQRTS